MSRVEGGDEGELDMIRLLVKRKSVSVGKEMVCDW